MCVMCKVTILVAKMFVYCIAIFAIARWCEHYSNNNTTVPPPTSFISLVRTGVVSMATLDRFSFCIQAINMLLVIFRTSEGMSFT